MILYTEKQLISAYTSLVAKLEISGHAELIPDVEEFREIYEAEWELYYSDEELH
tara:strand:- start:746 stop:907 length:162 start_codon:yes stop_codon:yes gene_type:complete